MALGEAAVGVKPSLSKIEGSTPFVTDGAAGKSGNGNCGNVSAATGRAISNATAANQMA
jgi:hypothetical protein